MGGNNVEWYARQVKKKLLSAVQTWILFVLPTRSRFTIRANIEAENWSSNYTD